MSHIDALSRAPVEVAGDTETEIINEKMEVLTLVTEEEQVMAMQRTDTRLKTIVDILCREESGRSVSESALVKEYVLESGLLYKKVEVNIWKLRYEKKHCRPIVYRKGDIVYIKRPPEATGESTKLQPKYRGPLIVTQGLPNDVYSVSALRAEEGRQYATTVHVSQMKSYHLPDSDSEEDDKQSSTTSEEQGVAEADPDRPQEEESAEQLSKSFAVLPPGVAKTARIRRPPRWHEDYEK